MEPIHKLGINPAIAKALSRGMIYPAMVVYLGYGLILMAKDPGGLSFFILAAVSLALVIRIELLIYVFLTWSLTANYWISNLELPWGVSYLDEFLTMLALGYLLAFAASKRRKFKRTPFGKCLFGYVGIVTVSGILHRVPPKVFVEFLLGFTKPIIWFYFLINLDPDAGFYRRLVKFIIVFCLIQTLLNTMWMLGINPLPNRELSSPVAVTEDLSKYDDYATGLSGSSRDIAYLTSTCLIIVTGYYAYQRQKRYLLLMSVLLYGLALTEVKMVYILLPLSVLCTILAATPRTAMKIVGILYLGLFSALLIFLANAFHERTITGLQAKEHYVLGLKAKETGYRNVLSFIKNDPIFVFVGHGPGMYGSSAAMRNETPLARKYIIPSFSTRVSFANATSGLIAIAGDAGPIALFLYLVILLLLYRFALRGLKRTQNTDLKIYSFTVATGIVLMIILASIRLGAGGFGNPFLDYIIWLTAAAAYSGFHRSEDE